MMNQKQAAEWAIAISRYWSDIGQINKNRALMYQAKSVVLHDRTLDRIMNGVERRPV